MKTMLISTTSVKSTLTFVIALFSFTVVSATNNNNITAINPEPAKSLVNESIIATITDKAVFLNWNTKAETANIHFEVERSSDMTNFKTVALVLDGFSTEGAGKRYAFKENSAVVKHGEPVYYRLKQVDEKGNVTFSETIKVQIGGGVQ